MPDFPPELVNYPIFSPPNPLLAEAASLPVKQGNRIQVNGRTVAATWSQQDQKIGIATGDLSQHLGMELLETGDSQQQPVRWFTPPGNTPNILFTWFTEQSRLLDITEFAVQADWY